MRSVYVKILAFSFATLIVALGGFVLVSHFIERRSMGEGPIDRMVSMQLEEAQDAYERGGSAGLKHYLDRLNRHMGAQHYLLDVNGRDVVNGTDLSRFMAGGCARTIDPACREPLRAGPPFGRRPVSPHCGCRAAILDPHAPSVLPADPRRSGRAVLASRPQHRFPLAASCTRRGAVRQRQSFGPCRSEAARRDRRARAGIRRHGRANGNAAQCVAAVAAGRLPRAALTARAPELRGRTRKDRAGSQRGRRAPAEGDRPPLRTGQLPTAGDASRG
jgi:hypothetical protein